MRRRDLNGRGPNGYRSHGAAGRRRGFTLIEVLVALAAGGLLVAAARTLIVGIADGADRLRRTTADTDAAANGERALRVLFGRLEVGTDSTRTFVGDRRVARFTTWCDTPDGVAERCGAAVAVDSLGGRPAFVAVLSTGEVLPLRRGFTTGHLLYLASAERGGRWVTTWPLGLTAPIAVGVVTDGDTTVVRIGARG